ncbi:MAG: hypothetical protein ABIP68_04790 [Ferruginibacter sp.]
MNDWTKYKVGKITNSNDFSNDCQKLETLKHVTHIESAIRILKDKNITAGLVYDKSLLNNDRILVNWLSPNNWNRGSRYGNIEFNFDFKKICEGHNYYWVEVMTNYNPHACRILITENDYSSTLKPYDPKNGDGPWYHNRKDDRHYWNGKFCLEFMIENNLSLSTCETISFTNHHKNYCNIDPKTCSDKNLLGIKARLRFFSGIIANEIYIQEDKVIPNNNLWNPIKCFYNDIENKIRKKKFLGNIKATHQSAISLVMASLNFLANDDDVNFRRTLLLFENSEEFLKVFGDLIIQKFCSITIDELKGD